MLGLIGIKKGVDVSIREKLVISPRTKDLISNSLKNITDEFVILSTCNRTEIYFKGQDINKELIFEILNSNVENRRAISRRFLAPHFIDFRIPSVYWSVFLDCQQTLISLIENVTVW